MYSEPKPEPRTRFEIWYELNSKSEIKFSQFVTLENPRNELNTTWTRSFPLLFFLLNFGHFLWFFKSYTLVQITQQWNFRKPKFDYLPNRITDSITILHWKYNTKPHIWWSCTPSWGSHTIKLKRETYPHQCIRFLFIRIIKSH